MNEQETKEKSISVLMKEIAETVKKQSEEPEKKKKKPVINFKKLSGKKKKQNYINAMILKTNQEIELQQVPVNDELIKLKNENPHAVTTDYVWHHKGQPVVIIPEWSFEPFRPQRLIDEAKAGKIRTPYDLKIEARYLARGQIEMKKGMKGKWFIWVIVGVVILGIIGKALKLF